MRAWPGDGGAVATRAGWWFDPDAPGRGVFVVDDDRTATVVCCHYGVDGAPVWHIAGPAAWHAGEMRAIARPQSAGWRAGGRGQRRCADAALHAPVRATLSWGDERIALVPQHPDSASWNGGAGRERGGLWVEDRATRVLAWSSRRSTHGCSRRCSRRTDGALRWRPSGARTSAPASGCASPAVRRVARRTGHRVRRTCSARRASPGRTRTAWSSSCPTDGTPCCAGRGSRARGALRRVPASRSRSRALENRSGRFQIRSRSFREVES